ncbi:hypothetical protein [uncultured Cloacibacillus sp.]|uniref:hypothetical protein n=1 Tax=uncultured Cloacibacillus sp. TaxID=889794 RepID=UPI0027D97A2F|nr:hypothetical protein [uncultured Cloacibacillus sp.]
MSGAPLRDKIEHDVYLMDMLLMDIKDGLTRKKPLPLRQYARCISTVADSMYGVLDMYEELRNADVS